MRVLVVDDQEEARVSLADFLNQCGAIVTTVASGSEALAMFTASAAVWTCALPSGAVAISTARFKLSC